jgi:hypothetical protein
VNTRIGFMLSLSLLVPVLSLLATNTYAQTSQTSGGLNNLVNSNVTSTTRIVSFVDNVTVTKFSIISPDKLSVDLRYSAKGDAPSVKVETGVININSGSVSQLPEQVEKLLANSSLANNSTNTTSLINEKLNALGDVLSESNGTAIVDKGWKSPKNVVVKLSGDGTVDNAVSVNVDVR